MLLVVSVFHCREVAALISGSCGVRVSCGDVFDSPTGLSDAPAVGFRICISALRNGEKSGLAAQANNFGGCLKFTCGAADVLDELLLFKLWHLLATLKQRRDLRDQRSICYLDPRQALYGILGGIRRANFGKHVGKIVEVGFEIIPILLIASLRPSSSPLDNASA